MRDKDRNTYKNLIILFWADILILIGVLLRMLYLKGPDFASTPASNISFERYAIMLSLICIPSVLKLFHTYHKKISSPENNKYEQKYILIYIIRLSIFNILAIMNMIGFYLYNSQNTMYLSIITILALFFCYPNIKDIKTQTEK